MSAIIAAAPAKRAWKHPGHALLTGVTGIGKTAMARVLARQYAAEGMASIVLDKFGDDWGPRALVTPDYDQFVRWVNTSKRCALFVDEAAETTTRSSAHNAMQAVATQGRHAEHVAHFITPGAMSIRKEIRDHLLRRFIFRLEEGAAQGLYRTHRNKLYLETPRLPAGVFVYAAQVEPFPEPKLYRVPGWRS